MQLGFAPALAVVTFRSLTPACPAPPLQPDRRGDPQLGDQVRVAAEVLLRPPEPRVGRDLAQFKNRTWISARL